MILLISVVLVVVSPFSFFFLFFFLAYKVVFIGFLLLHRVSVSIPPGKMAFEEINTYFAPYSSVGGGLIKIVI